MKKVAIYTRASTNDQNTDMQISDLTEYAQKRGWQIYEVYEDRIAGATKTRPRMDQLFIDSKQRKFDIVLVWKFDRFARSLKMLVDSLELFKDLGIDFVSFKESIDTTTAMGRLIFNINSAYAEFERELKQNGKSIRSISKELQLSKTTVMKYLGVIKIYLIGFILPMKVELSSKT